MTIATVSTVVVIWIAFVEMAAVEVVSNPIVVGLVVGIPAALLGFLGYRRSIKLDKVTAQAAILSEQGAGVQRVIDGLNQIIDQLQGDNKDLRETVGGLTTELRDVKRHYYELKTIIAKLEKSVNGE